ncbi:hypothetical protein [Aeromonas salmonicida]|uniref:hypothetical protein n=2 Tax=Aeromonas salmonicida TaxID=645 RepID=UPI0004488C96|nr:hypothetical protein [Aeromonas salmonicida]ELI6405363.1 hypothetical protein [Aeromonas salmonicida subsp. salmonicida]GAJ48866.1 hypothetical protein ASA01S_032_00520 [Aeromonas salmonicida subsp. masoucida NBRC 13784]ELM3642676.1 hypothetical protein [Aeromonas salmonicida subsp. salmonicida]QOI95186.1 hypothetical protein G7042_08800 [Aeromonas salmonicida subsp. masoucida]QYH30705.1 hypothetical protein G9457_12595 [Aeromonas salmonicida subsp. masoucida]
MLMMIDKPKIRILLGGVSQQQLPDNVLDLMISRYETEEAIAYFNICVSCLQWLIASTTASGDVSTSRSEKVGDITIFKGGGVSQLQAWKDLLKYIYKNPDYIDPTLSALKYLCVIGGVRKDMYQEVLHDPNSIGPFGYHQTIHAPSDFNY